MPKPTKGPRLGGSSSHQKAILANLATSLFEHGRIKTTEPKARALRPYAEKLITHAKKGTLHNRREVMKKIRDKDVVHTLFAEIGPFFADRNGGYTRIIKVEARKGDNAPMAVIELVREKDAALRTNLSDYIADRLHQDYGAVSSLFSEIENTTIEQYFIAQKIERVKELLAYGELSLGEIADKLNYSSTAHLSAQFKKVTGLTPSHFRKIGENRRKPLDKV